MSPDWPDVRISWLVKNEKCDKRSENGLPESFVKAKLILWIWIFIFRSQKSATGPLVSERSVQCTGWSLEALDWLIIGTHTPSGRVGCSSCMTFFEAFFDQFFDIVLGSLFSGLWCQLGSNLPPNLAPKSIKIRSKRGSKLPANLHPICDAFFIDLGNLLARFLVGFGCQVEGQVNKKIDHMASFWQVTWNYNLRDPRTR